MLCDFCLAPNPTWGYPAKDFVDFVAVEGNDVLVSTSDGTWAACEVCHDLIEKGNQAALLSRSLDKLVGQVPMEEARRMVADVHAKFFASRCGPAYRET